MWKWTNQLEDVELKRSHAHNENLFIPSSCSKHLWIAPQPEPTKFPLDICWNANWLVQVLDGKHFCRDIMSAAAMLYPRDTGYHRSPLWPLLHSLYACLMSCQWIWGERYICMFQAYLPEDRPLFLSSIYWDQKETFSLINRHYCWNLAHQCIWASHLISLGTQAITRV